MSERIIVKGNTKLLKPVITEIMALKQILDGLEIEGGSSNDREFITGRRYYPQVRLHFLQDSNFVPGIKSNISTSKRGLVGRLTYRLMDETSETISKAELSSLGERIKNIFGSNNGYVWSKGKELYCYADWSKGYQLQILAKTKAQASDLVTKILSLQGHAPVWKFLTKTANEAELEAYPEVPNKEIILGEQIELPKVRPLIDVRFSYADVRVHKLLKPIVIYDRKGKKAKSLVS